MLILFYLRSAKNILEVLMLFILVMVICYISSQLFYLDESNDLLEEFNSSLTSNETFHKELIKATEAATRLNMNGSHSQERICSSDNSSKILNCFK